MMAVTEGETTNSHNWLELPNDVTRIILQKLDAIEIVTGASGVCSLWWNICKDPSIWRTIVMTNLSSSPYDLEKICCFAVSRSCGLVEDLNIEYFATDDLLFHIADRTSNLRRLRLAYCKEFSKKGWLKVVKKCPLLEELDISFSCLRNDSLEDVGRCCPLLKTLKFNWPYDKWKMISFSTDDFQAFAIANTMPQLCHLQIMGNSLTNAGLLAILHGCPLLEFLDLRKCYYDDLTGNLGKKCCEQIKFVRRHPRPNDKISDDYPSHGNRRF